MEKSIFVGLHHPSAGQMSQSQGLSMLRSVTERGRKSLWIPFAPLGWSSECCDRLFWALGFEGWCCSSDSLYEWRGTATELVAISLRLDDHKIAAIKAYPDDFPAVWNAVRLMMLDRVEYEFSVVLRFGVTHHDAFRDRVIISSIDEPPAGLEELRPIARKVDTLLEQAAKTVWALVREEQQPALAAIRQRIERF